METSSQSANASALISADFPVREFQDYFLY